MDAIEDVKSRLNIEDVIGEYVQLKRAGRNWKGLSPFSDEKSPSFMVSPEKQIWHDFSSGRGGNVFSFIMEVEGLDFKGALELLARKAGVDLEQYRTARSGSRGKDKERLHQALEWATKFYQVQLRNNKQALQYVLGKRAFSKETVLEWRLGYSPNGGTALVDFLKSKGFKDGELKDAGLSAQRFKGAGDMFRGRIMIPLCDPQGRVIGFTARLLQDNPNAPKYINTPQTVLYDKSRHVFGLHLAKESIRKNKFVVVAEGNLDVITSHQASVRHVVATAGTALTEQHLQVLGRFTGDIRLSFDADKAGLNATERAIPIASKTKVSLSIISIPSGKDPDELIRQDPEVWKKVIQAPQYALDWLIARYQNVLDLSSAQGKRQFSDIILHVVQALEDPVEQDHYVGEVATLLGISNDALRSKLNGEITRAENKPLKKIKVKPTPIDENTRDAIQSQNLLLGIALSKPSLRHIALEPIAEDMLVGDEAPQLVRFLRAHPDFVGGPTVVEELRPIADYSKIVNDQFDDNYQGFDVGQLINEVEQLHKNLIGRYVKYKKALLEPQMQNPKNDEEEMELLREVNKLNQLESKYKGGA